MDRGEIEIPQGQFWSLKQRLQVKTSRAGKKKKPNPKPQLDATSSAAVGRAESR